MFDNLYICHLPTAYAYYRRLYYNASPNPNKILPAYNSMSSKVG